MRQPIDKPSPSASGNAPPLLQSGLSARLDWLSLLRGICSLWIVYFHTYTPYLERPFPKTNREFFATLHANYAEMELPWFAAGAGVAHDVLAAMSLHAVGIFILLSGFGITRSLLRSGRADTVDWRGWLVSRFWRLYPFLWLAHLVFLVAPFVWQPEPIDWRFALSLTGVRAYPMELLLFYANPAWWFFWLIVQLYLVFPLLFTLYRRCGVATLLALTIGATLVMRYVILFVWQDWRGMIIGGFFVARLAEFALGMALAELWRRDPERFTARLTGWRPLLAGLIVYPLGVLCYYSLETYLIVDLTTTAGLFLILAPLSRQLAKWRPLHSALALAGSVSLSTFLLHQPWTISAGIALRGQPWWVFGLACAALLPLMVAIAYCCEHGLRWLLARLRRTPSAGAALRGL